MKTGLDRFLQDPAVRRPLLGRRVALLAHPASVTGTLSHALDAIATLPDITLTAALGPQHGLRGDKQDNMVESPDFRDPLHRIRTPVPIRFFGRHRDAETVAVFPPRHGFLQSRYQSAVSEKKQHRLPLGRTLELAVALAQPVVKRNNLVFFDRHTRVAPAG